AGQRLDGWRGGRRPANRVKLDTLGARAADNSGSPTRRGPMTREGCVRMDAARVSAVFALLLTALASENCGRAKREPAAPPPPPASLVRVGTLRVGLPAPKRGNLLFNCFAPATAPRIGSATYLQDSLAASGWRWRRQPQPPAAPAGALAPDTLIVRAFEDATDEEIAFERGELDAAVFWPGELSARMRTDPRYGGPELGVRARGVLVCWSSTGDTLGAPRADMELLNREAFAGDLLPWSERHPGVDDGPPARYVVNGPPADQHLQHILARIPHAGITRTLQLLFEDVPMRAYGSPVRPLFLVRCAVLVKPEKRNDVQAIGAGVFADLAPCGGATSR